MENKTNEVKIYCAAAEKTPFYACLNNMAIAINKSGNINITVIGDAVPDSINRISSLDESKKGNYLATLPPCDFFPAINQEGVAWHAYNVANSDLKLVAALNDAAFGVITFDPSIKTPQDLRGKKIGVPARPSSVRIYSEVLLRDAWGILEDVELVDITDPRTVVSGIEGGEYIATTFNFLVQNAEGRYDSMFPQLMSIPGAHYLPVNEEAIAAINRSNPFFVAGIEVDTRLINNQGAQKSDKLLLLSFLQGLVAWDCTDDAVVREILEGISSQIGITNGAPQSLEDLFAWPAITPKYLHPASKAFMEENGILTK